MTGKGLCRIEILKIIFDLSNWNFHVYSKKSLNMYIELYTKRNCYVFRLWVFGGS